MHAGTNSFSERAFLASQFALTHEAEPDCVEYVKPVATTPGQECQVSGEEWIPFNHGFGERLLVLSVSAEEGFDGSGQVAQDPKPFPASPCLDVFCECSEILAQHGLCIKRFFDNKHFRAYRLAESKFWFAGTGFRLGYGVGLEFITVSAAEKFSRDILDLGFATEPGRNWFSGLHSFEGIDA